MKQKGKTCLQRILAVLLLAVLFAVQLPGSRVLAEPSADRAIVLLVDDSVSMEGEPIKKMKEAAHTFCDSMLKKDPNCQIAVVKIGTRTSHIGFSKDRERIGAFIDDMNARSWNTDAEAAIATADKLLAGSDAAEKSMVIMSDGLPSSGRKSKSGPYTRKDHKWYRQANGVCAQADELDRQYRILTMGFFDRLKGGELAFARDFLKELARDENFRSDQMGMLLGAFDELPEQRKQALTLRVSHQKQGDGYTITANIGNDNTGPVEDVEVVLELSDALHLTAGQSLVEIGTMKAGAGKEISWDVAVSGTKACEYTVTVKGTDIPDQWSERTLQPEKPQEKPANAKDHTYDTGKDIWDFPNYVVDALPLLPQDLEAFTYGMDESVKNYYLDVINTPHNGECYGMSSTSILFKTGNLKVSDYDPGASYVHDLDKNQITQSLIAYYQLSELLYGVQEDTRVFMAKTVEEQLTQIKNQAEQVSEGGTPFVLSFGMEGGGHSMVGYGYESGSWKKNGRTYDSRILTYDCNYAGEDLEAYVEDSYLYFNAGTGQWQIPNYFGQGAVDGTQSGYLMRATDELEHLDAKNVETFKHVTGTHLLAGKNTDLVVVTGDSSYVVNGDRLNRTQPGMTAYHASDYNPERPGTSGVHMLMKDSENSDAAISVQPGEASDQSLDVVLLEEDLYLSADAEHCQATEFLPSGISMDGAKGAYELKLATDEENQEIPWKTVSVSGENAGNIALSVQEDGYQITGDQLKDVVLTLGSGEEAQDFSFSTDEDTVLLTSRDGQPVLIENPDANAGKHTVMELTLPGGAEGDGGIPMGIVALIAAVAATVVFGVLLIKRKHRM